MGLWQCLPGSLAVHILLSPGDQSQFLSFLDSIEQWLTYMSKQGRTLEELDAVFAHAYNPFRRADAYYNSEREAEAPKEGDIQPYSSTDIKKPGGDIQRVSE
jgi:hypothetical protein